MKLTRISKPLRSVQARVTLSGELNAALDNYARYYQNVHGDPVEPRALIPEMLRAFIEADREFQTWSRSRSNGRPHHAVATSASVPCEDTVDRYCAAFADALGAAPARFRGGHVTHSPMKGACTFGGAERESP